MAAEPTKDDSHREESRLQQESTNGKSAAEPHVEEDDGDDDDDDAEEEEPKLKYTRLTSTLGPVYRNGDATSSFMVAGDKMVRAHAPRHQAITRCRTHAEF